jgi:HTH-type transcriptional repressor of NAD biosynthesis genes
MRKQYRHAVVIGKFYPPHAGHLHLIQEAARVADKVSVVVYGSRYYNIPAQTRVEWMYADLEVPDNNVTLYPAESDIYEDYNSDIIWDAHMSHLRAFLRVRGLEGVFDVVVASEEYANVMARDYFGGIAAHVVDTERVAFPISGTAFRNDAVANWNYLIPSARRALMPRVIVLGSESTGTTTLSKALSEHYNARWVAEYGAQYTFDRLAEGQAADPNFGMDDIVWDEKAFADIARMQTQLEDEAVLATDGCFPLFIGDTDAFATALWEKRYTSGISTYDAITRGYARDLPKRDLYIVTDHQGVTFEQNGIRDGEHIREDMTTDFEDALAMVNASWIKIRGTHEERMDAATHMIDGIIATAFEFTDPKRFSR